jgi:hypothetical protein
MSAAVSDPIPSPSKARSSLGHAVAHKRSPEVIAERRRTLAEANIAAAIERALADAPPLSDEQCERLAAMLRRVG